MSRRGSAGGGDDPRSVGLDTSPQGLEERPQVALVALVAQQGGSIDRLAHLPLACRLHRLLGALKVLDAAVAPIEAAGGDEAAGLGFAIQDEVLISDRDQGISKERPPVVHQAQVRPDDAGALDNLAQLPAESDPAQALAYAERASRLLPANPVVADTLGMLLFERGDKERARELLQAAHEGLPGDARVTFRYASVLAEIGDEEQARTLLVGIAQTGFPEQDEAKALLERLTK